MITIKDFMECVQYRISGGDEYQWDCYGPNARSLDSETEDGMGGFTSTIYIIFDTETQFVYEMQAWDYDANRAYRWIHPAFIEAHAAEAIDRDIDFNQSIDDQKFIDLEVVEDILEKATAIVDGVEYDNRVMVELTLDDAEMLQLMSYAHEKDMTLNQFVEYILQQKVN